MSFLKKIFGTSKSKNSINTPADFWKWFMEKEKIYFTSIKTQKRIHENLQIIVDKLHELNPELFCLIGMHNDQTAELIITPEGDIKNIVFAEQLAETAPAIPGWKITALKPEIGFNNLSIEMYDFEFNAEKIKFYTLPDISRPDEIEINVVHNDYTADKHQEIANGCLIFLDNAIGEITMATQIDNIKFDAPANGYDLIPIEKLKEYLLWREKEFIEKYEGVRYDTENDEYNALEAVDKNNLPMIAIINQKLLSWDAKASHPWMLAIDIAYTGNENGMPDDTTYRLMNEFEEGLMKELKDHEGYLNTGRQTYKNERAIFIACKEYRKSSGITKSLIKDYQDNLNISYSIYKDKYWKTLDSFAV